MSLCFDLIGSLQIDFWKYPWEEYLGEFFKYYLCSVKNETLISLEHSKPWQGGRCVMQGFPGPCFCVLNKEERGQWEEWL